MVGEHSPLAIIPSEHFRWRPRVQFIESFDTRPAAIGFALKHGYNLIVERNESPLALFDVLLDIDEVCTEGLNLEVTHTEEVLIEPDIHKLAGLRVWSFWRVRKRSAAALACQRQRGWRDIHRRFPVPLRIHRAASRCWWSNTVVAFRRWWHRHSHASATDLAKRFVAFADGLYRREVAPRLQQARQGYRQADIPGALRRAWNSPLATFSNFATRFAAAAAVFLNPEVAPVVLQAASNLRRAHIARVSRGNGETIAASRHMNNTQIG